MRLVSTDARARCTHAQMCFGTRVKSANTTKTDILQGRARTVICCVLDERIQIQRNWSPVKVSDACKVALCIKMPETCACMHTCCRNFSTRRSVPVNITEVNMGTYEGNPLVATPSFTL